MTQPQGIEQLDGLFVTEAGLAVAGRRQKNRVAADGFRQLGEGQLLALDLACRIVWVISASMVAGPVFSVAD